MTQIKRRRPFSKLRSIVTSWVISWLGLIILLFLLSLHLLGSSVDVSSDSPREQLQKTLSTSVPCPSLNETTTRGSTAAIASLVSNSEKDVNDLCRALKSLRLLPDNADPSLCRDLSPVLIFHEGSEDAGLSLEQREHLKSCTNRQVSFPVVHFDEYPAGFDPEKEEPNYRRRSKWGYQQMIRFWITKVWEHPSVRQFETIMRLDSDACYRRRIARESANGGGTGPHHWHVPGLPEPSGAAKGMRVVYHTGETQYDTARVTQHFGSFVHRYVREHNLTIHNPQLFEKIPDENEGPNAPVPMFYNNFEVSRVSFMLRPEVKAFHDALTEEEPFGVFRYRWGDAIERYATLAIFADDRELLRMPPIGYQHQCGGDSVLSDSWFW